MKNDSVSNGLMTIFDSLDRSYRLFFTAETTLIAFWDELVKFIPIILNDSRYQTCLGKENLETIKEYFINIRSKVQSFKKESRIGNDTDAQREENSALHVAGEMMRELGDVLLKTDDSQLSNVAYMAIKEDRIYLPGNEIKNTANLDGHTIRAIEEKPIHERSYHTFLSCKDVDKVKVDHIYQWLKEVAGIPVLYDTPDLPNIAHDESVITDGIPQCRSIILIISHASITTGWLEKEYVRARDEQYRFKDFRIIPVRIEDCDLPNFMQQTNCINVFNSNLDLETVNQFLTYLYQRSMGSELEKRDVYISRTWRKYDAGLANYVCSLLIQYGFRLIGDAKDQQLFYRKTDQERVKSIISSCGGFVSILPDRGGGATSDPMLTEIEIALGLKLPCLIAADPTVNLQGDLDKLALRLDLNSSEINEHKNLEKNIEKLWDEWERPISQHYSFLATDFSRVNNKRKQFIKEHIERITAMPCQIGQHIMSDDAQKTIIESISNAIIVIADISDNKDNTLIETGIALGSGIKLHPLIKKTDQDRGPPFMLSDLEVKPYSDDLELIGFIHRIAYQYRRRVLNYELAS